MGAGTAAFYHTHSGASWKDFPYRASANTLEMGAKPLAKAELFHSRL